MVKKPHDTMKLRFESDLDFQLQAVDAVCDLFQGQETCTTEFTVIQDQSDLRDTIGLPQNILGVGNRLTLPDDKIFKNLRTIQRRNHLPPSASLDTGDFTVEMETGTGKTYVYLRTIFELNKRYRFTKFIIVVPSVAIKEGVHKSLQMTEAHFRALYSGAQFDYFLYDSAKLGQVRNFVASPHIQIMVMTVGAINKKDINNLYKDSEKTGGEKPIDLIKATRPILIVDEPQSVDGGLRGRGKEALGLMDPMCTLRYSATHVDQHHMVYRLDAINAYERKLVKQIEVASAAVENAHNRPYVRLISTSNTRGISARVELDVETLGGHVHRTVKSVRDGDDIEQVTGRAVYHDCRIGEVGVGENGAFVRLYVPGGEYFLQKGEAWGDMDSTTIHRQMIRRTIREHLEKEKRLRPQGIKVLSLFFVDAVGNYRRYDEAGNAIKGVYARIFEEEYQLLAQTRDYQELFKEVDLTVAAGEAHDGYFSIDRKGGWTDTIENNQTNRDNAERAYSLIMKEKEKLLSLDEPLKFIFSHSALREGWDNPNVFQICVLRDIQTELGRRQTIGRGLRLCVNQRGERLRGFELNTLTVIARENYEEFAENLQHEIEKDTGRPLGVIGPDQFADIQVDDEGTEDFFGVDRSQRVYDDLRARSYIDKDGRIQDSLRKAVWDDTLILPNEFDRQRADIISVLQKFARGVEIKNADKRQIVRPRQAVIDSPEFRALWSRIKYKTAYHVTFDNKELLKEATKALKNSDHISPTHLQWRKAEISIGQAGVETSEISRAAPVALEDADIDLPDLLTELQDRTQLTRHSIYKILIRSERLDDFKRNPQQFIERTADIINRCKQCALINGIKYRRMGKNAYRALEFSEQELIGYLKNTITPKNPEKSVYEKVVYESAIERRFAEDLDAHESVKLYAKLPNWFKVPTPLGSYNPDWAVLIATDEGEQLYFVVETKGSTLLDDLRGAEADKIKCGKEHFRALQGCSKSAKYEVVTSVDELLERTLRDDGST